MTTEGAISVGKDLVSLLRDLAVFVLAALLLLFPAKFNSMLVNAGFEEGSLIGFKWKSNLRESNNALVAAQATISDLQVKNDELVKTLADTATKLRDTTALQDIEKLKDETLRLKGTAEQTQTNVSKAIESNAPLLKRALASLDRRSGVPHNKSDYSVGLQTLGIPDAERESLNKKLQADGYSLDSITVSYSAGDKPSWFASRSTVFYYAASSFPAAKELARFMKVLTGQDFVVQRGAGLGVNPERGDVTFFVHYVKK